MVDGVSYFATPDIDLSGTGLDEAAAPPGSCYSLPWQSMGAAPEASGALVDINNPTGLDIERLQEMVNTDAEELQPVPGESADDGGVVYSVAIADVGEDNYRQLQDMVVRVDAAGRVVSADWTELMGADDLYEESDIEAPGDTSWTETMSLTLSDFGIPVEVTAPAPEDTCGLEQSAVEHTCGFGAADIREAAMDEIYDGDFREGLREIVESFTEETNGSCPESLSVPLLVSSAACDPEMVRFLFEDLGMDPNQTDFSGDGHTALFSVTYYDPEDDPEFSEVCTPEQDLETVRVLLDSGADPCIGPDEEHEYDPALNALRTRQPSASPNGTKPLRSSNSSRRQQPAHPTDGRPRFRRYRAVVRRCHWSVVGGPTGRSATGSSLR